MMTLTDRLTRFLIARLRRHAIHDTYERAAEAGLLETAFIDRAAETGSVWKLPHQLPITLSGDDDADRRRIAALLRRSSPPTDFASPIDALIISDDDEPTGVRSIPKRRREEGEKTRLAKKRRTTPAGVAADATGEGRALERDRLLRLLRSCVTAPTPADVAVVLSVARAVSESVADLEELLLWMRRSDPMIIVAVPLQGFEERFGVMLEEGRITPRRLPQSDGLGHYALSGHYKAIPEASPYMITFSGSTIRLKSHQIFRHSLAKARLRGDAPIVIADESRSELPIQIMSSSDLVLRLPHIDRALIAELLHICVGIAPRAAFAAMSRAGFDPRAISLDDLTLAVRQDRSADRIIDILNTLQRSAEDESDEDGSTTKNDKAKSKGNTRSSSASKIGHRFEITQPVGERLPGNGDDASLASQHNALKIETLAGYGEAKEWALDLKTDLPLWRDKHIAWSEISSRLLLSGPPGTGKTTFARALCNSLSIPMLATSVAHWLEPGYLSDVLKLMSAAFETARLHAPSILFLDELDNIGRRSTDSRNADYWNSVINRLLELLDGVGKLDGVVVIAATNHPDMIDSAILRSGRLEKHVVIPMPNTDAIAGMIRHHLGADLDKVLASRPHPANNGAIPEQQRLDDKPEALSIAGPTPAKSRQAGGIA